MTREKRQNLISGGFKKLRSKMHYIMANEEHNFTMQYSFIESVVIVIE